MKILMCIFDIQDLGGIINHAEHLIYGLKKLGHSVDLVRLEDKEKVVSSSCGRDLSYDTFSGLPLDQRAGWYFPVENRIPLRSTNWKKYTKEYDLVIWEVPVPPKGDTSNFKNLYNIKPKQIAFIHDGNAMKMYPHIKLLEKKIDLFACVHPCALGNMQALKIKNCRLIVNPQALWPGRIGSDRDWHSRPRKISSFQTFKAWKRVDDLVRAVPFMSAHTRDIVLGGGGIEYYYMTSKDKRKPKYGTIWEDAIRAGMNYIGYVDEKERDVILSESRLLIDTSWSKGYSKYGSHFNRIMVDAIIRGCIPVVRDLAMKDNGIFKAGKHYIEIPYDATPVEFAGIVSHSLNMEDAQAVKMIRSGQKVVKKMFDAKKVAEELLSCI